MLLKAFVKFRGFSWLILIKGLTSSDLTAGLNNLKSVFG